ncbi:MAG: 50S ribosomal protein L2 [Candidatus Undinarchaeales archaeon]
MGKRIRAQKLGTSKKRQTPSHRFKGKVEHHALKKSKEGKVKGKIMDIIHDPGRNAPMAKVKFEDGTFVNMLASVDLKVGQEVSFGKDAEAEIGNSLDISQIPEGTAVYNIENIPGDGGKFARSAGNFGRVISHDAEGTIVQLPSGAFKTLDRKCRANVGIVAGGGFNEKPFVKAGNKWHNKKKRGRIYPRVSGVAMNTVDHPFGGGGHQHIGKPKSVKRGTSPGRKVGSISPKRTGKK